MQWSKDQLRVGEEPSEVTFPVSNSFIILRCWETHQTYIKRAENIKDTVNSKHFMKKLKWEYCSPLLVNFFRVILGRNGIPLIYEVRQSNVAVVVPDADFIKDYIYRYPLEGDAYNSDNREVHTYIVSFVAGNTTAEAKILSHVNN